MINIPGVSLTAATREERQPYRKEWMSDDQYECAEMFADLFRGWHHVNGPIHEHGTGICHNTHSCRLATFDFDMLTKIVIMSHDRCIRAEITHSGPRMLKIVLHKRHTREGQMHDRHPTMEQAIINARPASN